MMNDSLDKSSFSSEEGNIGILLLHGYTASPAEVRPMGEFLASKGMRVAAPLLPGHGTTPKDLNRRKWRELADCASEHFYELQSNCEKVFVGGLSMGGLLSLELASRAADVAGVIPMAAALYIKDPLHHLLPLLKHLLPYTPKNPDVLTRVEDPNCGELLWTYDKNPTRFADEVVDLALYVRERLKEIQLPALIFQGRHDQTVPVFAARKIYDGIASRDKELIILEKSGHCLSVDGERNFVFEKSWQWIQERC